MKRGEIVVVLIVLLASIGAVTFLVQDSSPTGFQSINSPPHATAQTTLTTEGQAIVNLDGYFSDADGDALTYEASDTAVQIEGNTLTFTAPPSFFGDYVVTLSISDGKDTIAKPFTFIVPPNSLSGNESPQAPSLAQHSPSHARDQPRAVLEPAPQPPAALPDASAPLLGRTVQGSKSISANPEDDLPACSGSINACCSINSAGTWTLSGDIDDNRGDTHGACVLVNSSDVTVDCLGHLFTNSTNRNAGSAIADELYVNGDAPNSGKSNVIVKNCAINAGYYRGIILHGNHELADANTIRITNFDLGDNGLGIDLSVGADIQTDVNATNNNITMISSPVGLRIGARSSGAPQAGSYGRATNNTITIENQSTFQHPVLPNDENMAAIKVRGGNQVITGNVITTNFSGIESAGYGIGNVSITNNTFLVPKANISAGQGWVVILAQAGLNGSTIANNSISIDANDNARESGIELDGAQNTTVQNNTITMHNVHQDAQGINVFSPSTNNTFADNVITLDGAGAGITFGGDQITVRGNTLDLFSNGTFDTFEALRVESIGSLSNSTIQYNAISISAAESVGIAMTPGVTVTDTSIQDNNITVNGTQNINTGIEMVSGPVHRVNITNNSIWVNGTASALTDSVGIQIRSGGSGLGITAASDLVQIANNSIVTNGTGGGNTAIDVRVSNSTISTNAIIADGVNQSTNGIQLTGATNVTLADNNIHVLGTDVDVGMVLGLTNGGLSRNIIRVAGVGGRNMGLDFFSARNTAVYNTTIEVRGIHDNFGINLTGSQGLLIENTTILTTGNRSYGIQLTANSSFNNFNNTILNTSEWIFDRALNNYTNTTFLTGNGSIDINGTFVINAESDINQSNLNISFNASFLNTSADSDLNISAQITLGGLSFSQPQIRVDIGDTGTFVPCPTLQCQQVSYSGGTIIFNVTHFTTYAISETPTNLTLTKTASPDPVVAGRQLNYTILVNNTGSADASNITVIESYDPRVVFVSSTPAASPNNSTFSIGNLTAGSATTINITVNVSGSLAQGTILTNNVSATFASVSGVNSTVNTTLNTTVSAPAMIFTNKTANQTSVTSGATTLNYTITLNNTGMETAYNVTLVDSFPSGVTLNSSIPTNTSASTWLFGDLAPNQTANLSLMVDLNISAVNGSTILNTYTVTFQLENGTTSIVTNSTSTPIANAPVSITTDTTLSTNHSFTGTGYSIDADNVTLDCNGTTIIYDAAGTGGDSGVLVVDRQNVTVKNCIIIDASVTGTGAGALNGTNMNRSTFLNNTIQANGSDQNIGIAVAFANNNTIENNTVSTIGTANRNFGISLLDNILETRVTGNRIATRGTGQNFGIKLEIFSLGNLNRNNLFDNNIITTTGTGTNNFGMSLIGFGAGTTSNNTIRNNSISTNGSSAFGLRLVSFENASFENNTVATSGTNAFAIETEAQSNDDFFNGNVLSDPVQWIRHVSVFGTGNFSYTNTTFRDGNGSIFIPGNITINLTTITPTDINRSMLNITFNQSFINSTAQPLLNQTATVTLNGLSFTDPQVVVDFEDDGTFTTCASPNCNESSYSGGTFVFNVSHFTSYAASETTNVTVCPINVTTDTTLTGNVSCPATAIQFLGSNAALDCAGYTVNYSSASAGNGVFSNNKRNVTVKNCIFLQTNISLGSSDGIELLNANDSLILNNTVNSYGSSSNALTGSILKNVSFVNNTFSAFHTGTATGFEITSANNLTINQNIGASAAGRGFFIISTANSTVTNNHGLRSRAGSTVLGIAFENTRNNTVINNTGEADVGISFVDSGNLTVRNDTGLSTASVAGIWLIDAANSTIQDSIATGISGSPGLRLQGSSLNMTIQNNTITSIGSNALWLLSDTNSNNTIYNNTIASSSTGLFIETSSTNNVVTNNSITSNTSIAFDLHGAFNLVYGNTIFADSAGIYAIGVYGNDETIANNIVSNNASPGTLQLNGANRVNVTGNIVSKPAAAGGVALQLDTLANNNYIFNNTGTSPGGVGILAEFNINNTFVNNTGISSGGTGFILSSSSNNTLVNNTGVSSSGAGILLSSSANNTFQNTRASSATSNPLSFSPGSNNSFTTLSLIGGSFAVRFDTGSGNNSFFGTSLETNGTWMSSDAGSNNQSFVNTTFLKPAVATLLVPANFTVPNSSTVTAASGLVLLSNFSKIAAAQTFLNTSAQITLLSVNVSGGSFFVDPEDDGTFVNCNSPQCVDSGSSGSTYIFNVTHFTSYAISSNATCPFSITTDTTLAANVTCPATAINILSSNVALDCAGYTVTWDTAGSGNDFGVNASGVNNVTIKNCNILAGNTSGGGNALGVRLSDVNTSLVLNNNITTNGSGGSNYGIDLFGPTTDTRIQNNHILSDGGGANDGLELENTDQGNLTISGNYISTAGGGSSVGIKSQVSVTNMTVANNTIHTDQGGPTSGGSNSGIEFGGSLANNLTIQNNLIFTGGLGGSEVGISFQQPGNGSLIINNTIVTNGTGGSNYAIDIFTFNDSTIKDNAVFPHGAFGSEEGVRVFNGGNVAVINNTIRTTSDTGGNNFGIEFTGGPNNNVLISHNSVQTNGTTSNYGVRLQNGNGASVKDNIINARGSTDSQNGIYLSNFGGGRNINVTNNTVATIGTDRNFGIRIEALSSSFIDNNTVSTNGTSVNNFGITISFNGNHNIVSNNNISTRGPTSPGIRIFNGGQNNTFAHNQITTVGTGSFGVNLTSANNNTFLDTILVSPTEWIATAPDGAANFTDTRFINQNGSIRIPGTFTITNLNVTQTKLNITSNNSFLNSTNLAILNQSAQITLNGLNFTDPRPVVDFEDDGTFATCSPPNCNESSYTGGVFVFNISHFTSYAASETVNVSTCPLNVMNDTTLAVNITCPATAINILADNVTLDCAGYNVSYANSATGNGVNATNRNNVTIKNCNAVKTNTSILSATAYVLIGNNNSALNNNATLEGTLTTGLSALAGSGDVIANNNILINGTSSGSGISLSGATFSTVENNTISIPGNSSSLNAALADSSGSNNTIRNNTAAGNDSSGILLSGTVNDTVVNNTATSVGNIGLNIFVGGPATNTNIALINNTAVSNTSSGIATQPNANANILAGNNGTSNVSIGIQLRSDNNIVQNSIGTNLNAGGAAEGIRLEGTGNTLENSTGIGSVGIRLSGAQSIVRGSNATTTVGLAFDVANSADLFNVRGVSTSGFGLFIESTGAASKNITNGTFLASTGRAISISSSQGAAFTNTTLQSNATWIQTDGTSNATFVNTLFDKQAGSIRILPNVTVPITQTINTARLNTSSNRSFLNAASLSYLNTTAQITLLNVTITGGAFFVDPEDDGTFVNCNGPQCVDSGSSGSTYIFNVSHFTSYAISSNATCPFSITTDTTLAANVTCPATAINVLADNVVLDCAGNTVNYSTSTSGFGINVTNRNNVTVKNCLIGQVNQSVIGASAISLSGTNHSTIANNSALSLNASGIILGVTHGNLISGNTLASNRGGNGIGDFSGENDTISFNNASSVTAEGMLMNSATNSTILNNNITRTLILFSSSNNNTLRNNLATGAVNTPGIRIITSANNTLINNTGIAGNGEAGISGGPEPNTYLNNTGIATNNGGFGVSNDGTPIIFNGNLGIATAGGSGIGITISNSDITNNTAITNSGLAFSAVITNVTLRANRATNYLVLNGANNTVAFNNGTNSTNGAITLSNTNTTLVEYESVPISLANAYNNTVQHVNNTNSPNQGIALSQSGNNTITNITWSSTNLVAMILITSSDNNTITNSTLSSTSLSALRISTSVGNQVRNVTATSGTGFGIQLVDALNNDINESVGRSTSDAGIYFTGSAVGSNGNRLTNDTFLSVTGDAIEFGGAPTGGANNNFTNTTLFANVSWISVEENPSTGNVFVNTLFDSGVPGSIRFPLNFTMPGNVTVPLGRLNVSTNLSFLNSTNLSFLNTTAQITLNGITSPTARPLVDFNDSGVFVNCDAPQCVLDSYVGTTFIFNVTGFTSYAAGETIVNIANVTVTKTDSPDPVNNGSLLTYHVTITNNGPSIVENVTAVELYPANVTLGTTAPAPTFGNDTFVFGTLTAGQSTTINITVTVSGNMTSGLLNNTVNVTFSSANGTNNTALVTQLTTVTTPSPTPSGGGGGGGGTNLFRTASLNRTNTTPQATVYPSRATTSPPPSQSPKSPAPAAPQQTSAAETTRAPPASESIAGEAARTDTLGSSAVAVSVPFIVGTALVLALVALAALLLTRKTHTHSRTAPAVHPVKQVKPVKQSKAAKPAPAPKLALVKTARQKDLSSLSNEIKQLDKMLKSYDKKLRR